MSKRSAEPPNPDDRSSGRRRAPNIEAVARAANVSVATVSRVMNGNPRVAPELADRVLHAVHALGYQPSATAQGLARGRTALVGIVVPDLANPMFQAVLRGLSSAAGADDYRVIVADSHEVIEEEPILVREMRRRCDALVLCAPRMADDLLLELIASQQPAIVVNRHVDGLEAPTVSVDHGAGMRDVRTHLSRLGHRRVAFLAGPRASAANQERLAALREDDEGRVEVVEVMAGAMFADGYAAVDEALRHEVTALIGYNDLVALGALGRLADLGLGVPSRISVVGFDDIPFAPFTNPPLTTVAVPQERIGVEAWLRLHAMISGAPVPAGVRFRPELTVRASTGRAAHSS